MDVRTLIWNVCAVLGLLSFVSPNQAATIGTGTRRRTWNRTRWEHTDVNLEELWRTILKLRAKKDAAHVQPRQNIPSDEDIVCHSVKAAKRKGHGRARIGYQTSAFKRVPWMLIMRVRPTVGKISEDDRICAGILISSKWILMAASCLIRDTRSTPDLDITVEGLSHVSSSKTGTTALSNVAEGNYEIHDKYFIDPEDDYYEHDVAVVKTEPLSDSTLTLRPSCLPVSDSGKAMCGRSCFVLGFVESEGKVKNTLVSTNVVPVSVTKSNESTIFAKPKPGFSYKLSGSTWYPGSPIVCSVVDKGIYEVVGIPNAYDIGEKEIAEFTRISFYLKWVTRVMWENE